MKPRKFSSAMVGGSISVIVLWVLKDFYGITTPSEVSAAIGALLTYAASVLIPDEYEA